MGVLYYLLYYLYYLSFVPGQLNGDPIFFVRIQDMAKGVKPEPM